MKGLLLGFILFITQSGFGQIAQHISVDNDPVDISGTASMIALIGIPLFVIIVGLWWLSKKPINFEITACGNNQVLRKELKHLANDRNIEKNRKVAQDRDYFEN